MTKCLCLICVIVACLLGVCRAQQKETPGSVVARKIALREQQRDEVLKQALAMRDFKRFVALVGRDGDTRLNALEWVAALPSAKDKAQILALLWKEGPVLVADGARTGGIAELMYEYDLQDRLVQLTYQVLGRPPPTLPSERRSLSTREEVEGLAARLQAVR